MAFGSSKTLLFRPAPFSYSPSRSLYFVGSRKLL